MTTDEWHVEARVWEAYAAGELDPVAEASVDAHVMSCPACRNSARTHVERVELEPVWQSIRAEVSRPQLPASVAWLRRLGVPHDDLVLLTASGGLLEAWAVAVGTALVCVFAVTFAPVHQQTSFLLLAPLVPVLAVVAAYDATDPLRTLLTSTPYSKLRLALLRTAATLAVAVPVTLAVSLVLPGLDSLTFMWLLPGLALTASTLVLLTWLRPWTAATSAGLAWAAVVTGTASLWQVSDLTGAGAQLTILVIGLVMTGVFVVRSTSYRLLGGEG